MKTLGYYNGEIGEIADMKVPMGDRGGYFGDGVYDATYGWNGSIFAIDEHIDRFFNSAALLEIKITMSKQEVRDLLYSLLAKMDKDIGGMLVYWQVTRGTAPRNHIFPDTTSNFWVMIRGFELRNTYSHFKAITLEDTRFLHCNIKTLNLIPSVIANEKAKRAGCDEAIFHRGERVTECAHSNVSILSGGVFRTAPADNLILPGIALAHLVSNCTKLGIPVDRTPYTVSDLLTADEIIISSSGALCVPVSLIDGKPVGGKAPALLRKIQDAVVREFEDYTGASLNMSAPA